MDAVKKQSHFSEDDLSRQVVDVAYCVHQKMGVGLLKSVDKVNENHAAQLMNYMRLSGIQTGFLINFNEQYFKEGIRRFVI
ncbi:MAG: GxxExxY protein [Alphaproteobacteria bacterium]|nr:GxxExxY protein [Alphaproteobacteria bacterium]